MQLDLKYALRYGPYSTSFQINPVQAKCLALIDQLPSCYCSPVNSSMAPSGGRVELVHFYFGAIPVLNILVFCYSFPLFSQLIQLITATLKWEC